MNIRIVLFGMGLAAAVSACSAGSSVPAPTISLAPTAAPTGPATASQSATIGTTPGQAVAAPVVQGYAPTITTPALSAPLNGTVTASTTVPAGIASLDLLRATPPGTRQTAAKPANASVLLYVNIVPTATTTASGDIAFGFALPNKPTGANAYYLAFFDGRTWHTDYLTAPGTLTDTGVRFPSVTLPAPVTLIAGNRYAIALYSVPANATPAPEVLLAPIAAKPPAGSPPLASTLGARDVALDPTAGTTTLDGIRLLAGVAAVDVAGATTATKLSYRVYDGIPPAITINHPPEDGVVQGVLGITPATDVTFAKGARFALRFTPDSGVVSKYDLGFIVGSEAVTGGVQTDDGATATVAYTLANAVTFPAGQTFYVGFGLQDGGFEDDGSPHGDGKSTPGPSSSPLAAR